MVTQVPTSEEVESFFIGERERLMAERAAKLMEVDEIDGRLAAIHTLERAYTPAYSPITAPVRIPTSERDPEWTDKLRGMNQGECLILIAREYGGKLNVPVATNIMVKSGHLQIKPNLAQARVSHLARRTNAFFEENHLSFRLK